MVPLQYIVASPSWEQPDQSLLHTHPKKMIPQNLLNIITQQAHFHKLEGHLGAKVSFQAERESLHHYNNKHTQGILSA